MAGLEAEDIGEREEAEDLLIDLGPRVHKALKKAQSSLDPEVRFRVERILKEIRTPSFTRIHVPFPPCAGVPRERLFLLVQTKEEWDAITDTAGGAPSADPPGPPPPDFGRKIVLLLFGGSKPSTGYVTRVEAIERKTPADVLEISFRDGLVDPDLPQSTVITHPFSAWELRKTTKNIILKNLQDSDDRVRFNLAEAALLSSLGPERAERAFAKISDKDSVVRKTSIERLQEASSEASNRAVLSSLSAERDPTVILALFRYIRSHRSTFREQAILEAVRKNPFFDGAGHSLPGAILAKQVVRYLSEYGTDESTEFLQKHYFSLACRVCPTSVLEVASLLAKRKQLTSDIAYDFIQHYGALESILLGLSEFGDPRILETCLAGMEGYVEFVSKICLRWFLKLSPQTFGLDEKRSTTEQRESLKATRVWLTENYQKLRWNTETKKFQAQ